MIQIVELNAMIEDNVEGEGEEKEQEEMVHTLRSMNHTSIS